MFPQTITHCMLTDLSKSVTVSRGWQISRNAIHTGVDIELTQVCSVCRGVVIDIGQDLYESGYSIIIQYDVNQCVRYGHIKQVSVVVGQVIETHQVIGIANKFVHFEYLHTQVPSNDMFPVRVGTVTYYKYNPTGLVVNADVLLPDTNRTEIDIVQNWTAIPKPTLSDNMYSELYGGRDV